MAPPPPASPWWPGATTGLPLLARARWPAPPLDSLLRCARPARPPAAGFSLVARRHRRSPPARPRPVACSSPRLAPALRPARSASGRRPPPVPSESAARHQQFRARAKTRVDDLEDMLSGLQSARKNARSTDASVLKAQLHQMLGECCAEPSVPSPSSSLQGNKLELSDPSSEMLRLLQLAAAEEEEEEEDATSKLLDQRLKYILTSKA